MLTMRAAAALLGSATSLDGLGDVVRAAGIANGTADLSVATRKDLGVDDARASRLVAGVGAVRALLLQFRSSAPLRDPLQRIARRLSARAPHVLWFVAAIDETGAQGGIVALAPEVGPRVASFLWEQGRVVDSDAETLCALAAVRVDDDALYHARCTEVLGRDALTRRFYRALQSRIDALAATAPPRVPVEDARGIALLYASRLLFLQFLEAKGWLDRNRGFLAVRFDECMRSGGAFHRRVLLPLFFGTLNTPCSRRAPAARAFGRIPFLNGGLFTRTGVERRAGVWRFPDEMLGTLFEQLFQRFRFVAREDSATWSEASVDPEMLGRAFESLMATSERRAGGVYFTPHALVANVAERALAAASTRWTLASLRDIRVLDPACGSGAFLVYVLERLASMRRDIGDVRPAASIRRDVLAASVFGVDRNPTAVWLCELRLWLSVVIESDEDDPMRVPPLPNLDRNIRVGDALVGQSFIAGRDAVVGSARVEQLRASYIQATGSRKQNLARALDREERRRVLAQSERDIAATRHERRERLAALRARDLFGDRVPSGAESRRESRRLRDQLRALRGERRRLMDGGALPFSFHAFFADAQAHGGFDVILGNPPWVRLHHIPAPLRLRLREHYEVFRFASWKTGAAAARASAGFASQVDLAALFVERSVALLRDGGVLSLLLPAKLWRSLAGGGVRHLLMTRARLLRLEDLSESDHAFDAAVYPSLVVARAGVAPAADVTLAIHDRTRSREWTVPSAELGFDRSAGAPWMLLNPEARLAFNRVRAAGPALATSGFGPPRLGVKSGCNAAFVVRVTDAAHGIASVVDVDGETGSVELNMLRPALRGDAVAPWTRQPCAEWIVWTHDGAGAPLARLPDRCRTWLRRRYGELALRTDATRSKRWWSLFRVDAADAAATRLVWADFGRRPRAAVLPAGDPTVPLNTCYVLHCADADDAWALATLLNSPLAAAWLNAVAEPARGGYRRYLGWTVGLLPLPPDWSRARTLLAEARFGGDEQLLDATLAAYRLSRADVLALLQWGP